MPHENGAKTPAAWADAVAAALDEHGDRPGALMPVLHGIQDALGYVPPDAVPEIAKRLNLSRAEVHGVISFYHDFREHPGGRATIKICRAESCQAVGADDLIAHLKQQLGIDFHETTPDGAITLEPVYCLGNCALSPALTVGDQIQGRLTRERLDTLVSELRGAS
jgi:formate dehydrogenase subunit gamma